MNWAFELLGLRPDADIADVKRAYARMLRITRPDDDPEAFQRLHTAYKMVLAQVNAKTAAASSSTSVHFAQAQSSSEQSSSPTPSASSSPSVPAHTENVTAPAIHLGVLANEVIRAAVESENGSTLSRWLQSRSEFWSVQVKQQTAHMVLQRLFQQPEAISTDCMDALLRFFDLDHVLSGVNPAALQTLRRRQLVLWELLPANHHVLAQRIGKQYGSYPEVGFLKKDIALLQRPFSWPRTLRTALQIGRTNEIGHLVHALLGHGRFDELPASIDRAHAFFWFRATTRGPMTWPHFAMRSFQMGLAAFACALIVSVIYFLAGPSVASRSNVLVAVNAYAITWTVVFSLWLIFAGAICFDQWQGLPESTPSRWPWLRRLALPAMCAAGLAAYETGGAPYARWLIMVCFIAAMRKFRRRSPGNSGFFARITASTPAFIWISVWIIAALSRTQGIEDFPLIPILAFSTFAMSIADLWRHRAYLHPKLARN